ncbi:MAG: hypothetical protein IPN34_15200 [Planctomycetes bacterium]|nr:hypothetical protein [Planctomycetota bacterium]
MKIHRPSIWGVALVLCAAIEEARAQGYAGALETGGSGLMRVFQNASIEPSSPFTLEAWARPASVNVGYSSILRKANIDLPGFALKLADGAARASAVAYLTAQSYVAQDPTNNLRFLQRWTHFAMVVVPRGSIYLYIDGQRVATVAYPTLVQHTGDLWFGGMDRGSSYVEVFHGHIDEVRFWKRARTEAEIRRERFCKFTTGQDLVSTWLFDGDSRDSTGGNHGQLLFLAAVVPSDCPVGRSFDVSRASGSWFGGERVRLTGHFPAGPAPTVDFGGVLSPSVSFVDPQTIEVVVPPGVPGAAVMVRADFQGAVQLGASTYLYLPRLHVDPEAYLGLPIAVRTELAGPGALILFAGISQAISLPIPPFGGALGIQPPVVELLSTATSFTAVEWSLGLPAEPSYLGLELLFQSFTLQPGSPGLGAFTNLGQVRVVH